MYERNGTVYLNINGQIQTISSHGVKHHAVPMMPKLSASKRFISYTLCNDKNNSCNMIVKEIASKREVVLEGAKELTWHSVIDILLYALSKEDKEHKSIESEIYLYDAQGMHLTQLTQSKEFVEINPIFSEEGDVIYCEEAKSKKLLFLVIAFMRAKDGFKPAWFYLLGWTSLLLATFLMYHFHFKDFTMFVGAFMEAVTLAWGLVYVSGFGVKSKCLKQ